MVSKLLFSACAIFHKYKSPLLFVVDAFHHFGLRNLNSNLGSCVPNNLLHLFCHLMTHTVFYGTSIFMENSKLFCNFFCYYFIV